MLVSTKAVMLSRTMVDLAIHGDGEPVKIKDIANRQGYPVNIWSRLSLSYPEPDLCAASGEIRGAIIWPDRHRTIRWVPF